MLVRGGMGEVVLKRKGEMDSMAETLKDVTVKIKSCGDLYVNNNKLCWLRRFAKRMNVTST